MRNLRNVQRYILQNPGDAILTASAWDVASESVLCAYGPTKNDVSINLKRWKAVDTSGERSHELEHIASWDAPCPLPDLECDSILDFHYISESSSSCFVLAGGDIVVVREEPGYGEEKTEIVGSVDAGISAAAWSPDEELLAIATRANTLLYMTKDFENVADISLKSDDLKASYQVSVGWGKSETQFKGKGVKALRDPTIPENVDEGTLNENDNKESTLTWRGDGAYVALNSVEGDFRRVIRVYSRDGILDSVSEPVNGLESALSWRPAGNLLAGIQRTVDQLKVVFFERNGLRHGQFNLRLTPIEMASWGAKISLSWNTDSSVLAVGFTDRVQLWTMGNYHYYLKQEITQLHSAESRNAASTKWHPEKPLRLLFETEAGVQQLEYVMDVSQGSTSPPSDHGLVAVIDGKILKLTPLRYASVPPPMSVHEINLDDPIIDVAMISAQDDPNFLRVAILSPTAVSMFALNPIKTPSSSPTLVSTVATKDILSCDANPDRSPQQIVLLNETTSIILFSSSDEDGIGCLSLLSSGARISEHHLPGPTHTILAAHSRGRSSLCRLTGDGRLLRDAGFLDKNSIFHPYDRPISRFDKATAAIAINWLGNDNQIPSPEDHDPELNQSNAVFFGRSDNGILSANGQRLAKDCTSFIVTTAHLIFTTSQNLLKFVHMAPAQAMEVPSDASETDERCRSIERGAKIVTVMPSIFALVVQMPRGNLETIYPRALVLAGIRKSIEEKKYRKAFLACRNHRVDMNILHDHAPSAFLEDASLFVDQVKKVEHIDLFLSQLREEDVSISMYRETLNGEKIPVSEHADSSILPRTSKVNRICDVFINALQSRIETNLQNVITAHVCKTPPDLEAGLAEVAKLQKNSAEAAERAVEHICFLADVNRLYNDALGMYNLELALLVAQQSQKDPREYLPFLQKLHELSILQRQHEIDDYLKRYPKALAHLHKLGDNDAVKAYSIKHALYTDALQLSRHNEDAYRDILRSYADFLASMAKNREAAYAYEYLENYHAATEAYRLAHLWQEALTCAYLIPERPVELLTSLTAALSDDLLESKNHQAAATIQLEYLGDFISAARILCKGYYFAEATRILSLHDSSDSMPELLDAGLGEGMALMTGFLAECKGQINAQVPRLRELRVKKAEEPLNFFDGDVNGGADIPDNVSLAATDASTTGGSLFTRYTNATGTIGTNATRRTSRNRRREERKRARGKKGSVYEEEYLVNSIRRLIEKVNGACDEVERLVAGLLRRGMRERARAVEQAMLELTSMCKDCVDEVFQVNKTEPVQFNGHREHASDRPSGGDGVLWDNVENSQEHQEPPILRAFQKLQLLGN